jgi:hypothetical protein
VPQARTKRERKKDRKKRNKDGDKRLTYWHENGAQEVLVGDAFQNNLDVALQQAALCEILALQGQGLRHLFPARLRLEHGALKNIKIKIKSINEGFYIAQYLR